MLSSLAETVLISNSRWLAKVLRIELLHFRAQSRIGVPGVVGCSGEVIEEPMLMGQPDRLVAVLQVVSRKLDADYPVDITVSRSSTFKASQNPTARSSNASEL